MDRNRAFAFIAVGRESSDMDYLVIGEQFARGSKVVEEFLVGGQHRFDIHWVQEFEPLRAVEPISMDSYVAVAP